MWTLSRGRMWVLGLLAAAGLGCSEQARPPVECYGDCLFEVGGADDPVVQRARSALSTSPDAVSITIDNTTPRTFTECLLTQAQTFTVDQTASSVFAAYVKGLKKPKDVANAMGLTLGTNAWTVAKIAPGTKYTFNAQVPPGGSLHLSCLPNKAGELVGFQNLASSTSTGGVLLRGYHLDSANVVRYGSSYGDPISGVDTGVVNQTDCPTYLTAAQTLFSDGFEADPNNPAWPQSVGYDGDFNGDWYTDGQTARFYNPTWGGSTATLPAMSGFVKFLDVCPGAGATLSFTAQLTTDLSEAASDTTLVVYFFDRAGGLISYTTSHSLRDRITRGLSVYDAAIPEATRRIALVPVAFFAPAEQGSVYYDRIQADFEPSGAHSRTVVLSEDFSQTESGAYGENQPVGFTEYGGDWFVQSPYAFATLHNAAWTGGSTAEAGLVKTFSVAGQYAAGDFFDAQVFAANTFSDGSSFVLLRVSFDTGQSFDSERLNRGWGNVVLRRIPVPAGATSATVSVVAVLGGAESSSLYVDNLAFSTGR